MKTNNMKLTLTKQEAKEIIKELSKNQNLEIEFSEDMIASGLDKNIEKTEKIISELTSVRKLTIPRKMTFLFIPCLGFLIWKSCMHRNKINFSGQGSYSAGHKDIEKNKCCYN